MFEPLHLSLTGRLVSSVLITSILATAVTFYLQTRFQKDTSSTRAGLIYALEPVFAVIFAYLISHEVLSGQEMIGGVLMLTAILIAELGKTR